MPVKIVTDSVADIPRDTVEELGITVIPVLVRFGEEIYRDGIDITTDRFYDRLAHSKFLPATSVPAPAVFAGTYDKLAEETDEIIAITVTARLSGIYDAALQSVGLMKRKCRVEVVDSQWAVMAEGFIVMKAAQAAQGGASLDEILDLTHRHIKRVDIRAAFDTLEYLNRGGRIGKAHTFLSSVLRVNPVLGIRGGEVYPFAREHSRTKATDYLFHFATGFSHIEGMAVEDATTPDEADELAKRIGAQFPNETIYRTKFGLVVGAHVGSRVLAVSVLGDKG